MSEINNILFSFVPVEYLLIEESVTIIFLIKIVYRTFIGAVNKMYNIEMSQTFF